MGVAVAKLKAYLINCSNNERHLKQTGAYKKGTNIGDVE